MVADIHTHIGRIAGALSFLAFVPYVVATLRRKTRPNRATWVIWSAVGASLLVSYAASGARETLWVAIANLIAFVFILILSVRYGEGGWTAFDKACLFGAGLGFFLWWWFDSPLPTLFSGLFIDLAGALPTLKKAWKKPDSENLTAWLLFLAANILNLFAIRDWNVVVASYPIYMACITGALVAVLTLSKNRTDHSVIS